MENYFSWPAQIPWSCSLLVPWLSCYVALFNNIEKCTNHCQFKKKKVFFGRFQQRRPESIDYESLLCINQFTCYNPCYWRIDQMSVETITNTVFFPRHQINFNGYVLTSRSYASISYSWLFYAVNFHRITIEAGNPLHSIRCISAAQCNKICRLQINIGL